MGSVIDVQLVQVKHYISFTNLCKSNEVKSSYHMKIEGLVRAVQNLHEEGFAIAVLVTDRHSQISKVGEREPNLTQTIAMIFGM